MKRLPEERAKAARQDKLNTMTTIAGGCLVVVFLAIQYIRAIFFDGSPELPLWLRIVGLGALAACVVVIYFMFTINSQIERRIISTGVAGSVA